MAQEALLVALERPPRGVRDELGLRSWLATVVRNKARDEARGEHRRRERERESARLDVETGVHQALERVTLQRDLAEALIGLPANYRDPLVLRYFDGVPPREIARRTGLSGTAVRSRLSRGLEMLRERLDDRYGPGRSVWGVGLVGLAWSAEGWGRTARRLALVRGGLVVLAAGTTLSAVVWLGSGSGRESLERSEVSRPMPVVGSVARELGAKSVTAASLVEPSAESRRRVKAAPGVAASGVGELSEADGSNDDSSDQMTITARLTDDQGRPIAGGELWIDRPKDLHSQSSDRSGSIELVCDWSQLEVYYPQSCTFTLAAAGYATQTRREHLREPGILDLGTVVLPPGGAVEGRVVDEDGRPIEGAWVFPAGAVDMTDTTVREVMESAIASVVGRPTRSGADGSYRLNGLPLTHTSPGCRAFGTFFAYGPPTEVLHGVTQRVPDLVLRRAPATRRIDGTVLTPYGGPDVGASVRLLSADGVTVFSQSALSESPDGRFDFVVTAETDYLLEARDVGRRVHSERWKSVKRAVRSGDTQVVLPFQNDRYFVISVRASDGGELRMLHGAVTVQETRGVAGGQAESEDGETLQLLIPQEPFHVRVWAQGYRSGFEGPFDPAAAPDGIEFVLETDEGVFGRLISNGRPVVGSVDAHEVGRDRGLLVSRDGFFAKTNPRTSLFVRTDRGGRFFLPVREPTTLLLHAMAEGHATTSLEPQVYRPESDAEELVIEMGLGGELVGRVISDDGRDVLGTLVGATLGHGHVVTQRVGATGAFRFQSLAPGQWQVGVADQEESVGHPRRYSTAKSKAKFPIAAVVVSGESVHCDVALPRKNEFEVAGRLALSGDPFSGWRLATDAGSKGATLEPDGRFRFEVNGLGTRRVYFRSTPTRLGMAVFVWTIDVQGPMLDVERVVPTGSVAFVGLPAVTTSGEEISWALLWENGDLSWTYLFKTVDGSPLSLDHVPAGHLRLTSQTSVYSGGRNPEHLIEHRFVVVAGETFELDLR